MEDRAFFDINIRCRQGGNPSGLLAALDAIGLLHALTPSLDLLYLLANIGKIRLFAVPFRVNPP